MTLHNVIAASKFFFRVCVFCRAMLFCNSVRLCRVVMLHQGAFSEVEIAYNTLFVRENVFQWLVDAVSSVARQLRWA